jgi:hypothetical protein
MKTTYIEWMHPGSFVSESTTEKVKNRDIPNVFPKTAYAFRFFDMTEVVSNEGESLKGSARNHSGFYYIGGVSLTIEDVKRLHPDKRILISNMENNNWNRIVMTRFNQAMPLNNDDTIIEQ